MLAELIKGDIHKQFSKHRKDFIQKLRSLKTTDPKSYWSLLNKANSSGQSKVLVYLEAKKNVLRLYRL